MITAWLNEGRIQLVSEWSSKDLIKTIPGASWSNDLKAWTLPLSWASAKQLRGTFGAGLRVDPSLIPWATNELASRINPALAVRDALVSADDDREDTKIIHSWRGTDGVPDLFPYQEAGAQFLVRAGRALLADEMGTGKTCTVLSAMRTVEEAGAQVYPALIVCPNTVKTHWWTQVRMWLEHTGAKPFVLSGSVLARRKTLAVAATHPKAVVIVNIEGVRGLSRLAPYGSVRLNKCRGCDKTSGDPTLPPTRCETHPKELNTFGFRTCILDEAHRAKDPKAKQTRAVWAVFHGPTVQNAWALTGTPVASHVGDLWSVMHAVAPVEYPRRSAFIERYAMIIHNAFGMEIIGLNQEHREELFTILDPRFRRVVKTQVLSHLPPRVPSKRQVEMSPKQRRIYDALEQRAMAVLESGELLTAPNNLTLATRLLQLTSSTVDIEYGEDPDDYTAWKVTPQEPSSKIDEVMTIISELEGAPVVIAAEHRRLLELLGTRLTKLGIKFVSVTGAVSEFQRGENIAAFQDPHSGINVILVTIKAGGVGITLTRAGTLIMMQRSWSQVENLQMYDRVHRIGSEIHASINIIHLVAEGTIEDEQLDALDGKQGQMKEVTRD